jgi:hypothetical protein
MHVAPPVRVSLGRSRRWLIFVALLAAAGVGNATAWMLLHVEAPHAALGALVAAIGAAVLGAAWAWRARGPGVLAWDGGAWWWGEREGAARVALDLDGWLLLRFEPIDGRRLWVAASASQCVGSWAELRAALYSPRVAEPLDEPPPV